MNYEQKYKEALDRAKKELQTCGSTDCDATRQIFRLFPELAESEDERIRKALIKYLDALDDDEVRYGVSFKDMRVWLEKQGEQKSTDKVEPRFEVGDCIRYRGDNYKIKDIETTKHGFIYNVAVIGKPSDPEEIKTAIGIAAEKDMVKIEQPSWSEDDKKMKSLIISTLTSMGTLNLERYHHMNLDDVKNWFKSLKDRVQPQPKQEWSEEDKSMYIRTLGILGKCYMGELPTKVEEELRWFKSIEPQSHWKPSEQNLKDLEWCADLVKDKMGVGFHRLQVFIDEIKTL